MFTNDQQVSGVIVGRLNDVWRSIQSHHPDVPDVFIVTKASGRSRRGLTFGHYHAGQWDVAETTTPEVMLSGECLHSGAEQILQTLIHEAVHALAKAREVQETSRQGRYHNHKFVNLANELGLAWQTDDQGVDLRPDSKIGYSAVVLTDALRERYAMEIKRLACLPVGKGSGGTAPAPKPTPPRVKVTCGCRTATFGPKAWEELTPLVCGLCDGEFHPTAE